MENTRQKRSWETNKQSVNRTCWMHERVMIKLEKRNYCQGKQASRQAGLYISLFPLHHWCDTVPPPDSLMNRLSNGKETKMGGRHCGTDTP